MSGETKVRRYEPRVESTPFRHDEWRVTLPGESEDNNGRYVLYSGYSALAARVRELEGENEKLREDQKKYMELIYGVARAFPGESRHETALRYILERENRPWSGPDQEAKVTP